MENLTSSSRGLTKLLECWVRFGFELKLSIFEAFRFRVFGARNFKGINNDDLIPCGQIQRQNISGLE